MSEIKPKKYWNRIPRKIAPYISFYNIPISIHADNKQIVSSVVNFIETIAKVDDFVSFKLDIDNSEVELPIITDLLNRPKLATLVDEFFFEFHFRCEIMMRWWERNQKIRMESHGFILDRPHVLKVFQQLRYKGIRSHFWI